MPPTTTHPTLSWPVWRADTVTSQTLILTDAQWLVWFGVLA